MSISRKKHRPAAVGPADAGLLPVMKGGAGDLEHRPGPAKTGGTGAVCLAAARTKCAGNRNVHDKAPIGEDTSCENGREKRPAKNTKCPSFG